MQGKPDLKDVFPEWQQLTAQQQQALQSNTTELFFKKGEIVTRTAEACLGALFVEQGQLRVFITSENGKEITICRFFDYDTCLLTASCIIKDIQFDITMQAEKDTTVFVIAPYTYKMLMEESLAVANLTNRIISSHMTELMWTMEQVMFKSFDCRLAAFLMQQADIEQTATLHFTHEEIANHLGTAREVVTRMLKHFHSEGYVELARGQIIITDAARLQALAA